MKQRIIALFLVLVSCTLSAQIRYTAQGVLTMGNTTQFGDYQITIAGNGAYFKHTNNRFLQLSVMQTGAPRIAGHNGQIVFYNSQTSTFNSIQVSQVYNYSDANAKTGVRNFKSGLDVVSKLRPVSYNFLGNQKREAPYNMYTGANAEIGLLAQELEMVLPNLVFTDEDGHKLVDYVSLVPVLIDAIQSLQKEVELLKAAK